MLVALRSDVQSVILRSSEQSSWWEKSPIGVVFGMLWNGVDCPRKRRDPKPRSVVDFTGGPVADLTLRSRTDSGHPTTKHVRTTVATL